MSEREHQSSNYEYQVRVNGKPIGFWSMTTTEIFEMYADACKANPNEYVDIVHVRTEILMNQGTYHQMKKHFAIAEGQIEQPLLRDNEYHCAHCKTDVCCECFAPSTPDL